MSDRALFRDGSVASSTSCRSEHRHRGINVRTSLGPPRAIRGSGTFAERRWLLLRRRTGRFSDDPTPWQPHAEHVCSGTCGRTLPQAALQVRAPLFAPHPQCPFHRHGIG